MYYSLILEQGIEFIKSINVVWWVVTLTHVFHKYIYVIIKYLIKSCQIILLHINILYNDIDLPN